MVIRIDGGTQDCAFPPRVWQALPRVPNPARHSFPWYGVFSFRLRLPRRRLAWLKSLILEQLKSGAQRLLHIGIGVTMCSTTKVQRLHGLPGRIPTLCKGLVSVASRLGVRRSEPSFRMNPPVFRPQCEASTWQQSLLHHRDQNLQVRH